MGEPAIEIQGLVKRYGAVAGINLRVAEGTILGLRRRNGAGKTTLVRVLATLLRPDAGIARVAGLDVVSQATTVRRAIGLSGQFAAVDGYLTGRENLRMIGRLTGLDRAHAARRADELLEVLDLHDAATRLVRSYSGGMRRRLDLAASLMKRPTVLFLDEPTTGLDPRGRLGLWSTINELAEQGTTVLLTTQYLEEADRLADHIAVIDDGRLIASGTPDELKARLGGNRLEIRIPPGPDTTRLNSAITSMTTHPVVIDRSDAIDDKPSRGIPWLLGDVAMITARNLRRPTLITFATVQPILFVLLFASAFGGAIHPPGVTEYVDYLLPGLYVLAIAFGASQTGVAIADDLATGMIDRFRSLPMTRSAVLAGRTLADAIRNLFVLLLMTGVAAAIGFRFHAGAPAAVAAIAPALLTGIALSWINALIGLLVYRQTAAT